MTAQPPVHLAHGAVSATVLPDEGGVLIDLLVHGRPVLARTPWASAVAPAARPAPTEDEWVARWRGGWQLCFPTAGQPDARAQPAQSFHGVASQAPWLLVSQSTDSAALGWNDREGLWAERLWRATEHGISVATRVGNDGDDTRVLAIAEHLILGGDVLAGPLAIDVDPATMLRPLDYAGLPAGDATPWPGDDAERFTIVDAATPARVAALQTVRPQRVKVTGPHVRAAVSWQGETLPHALLWQELGVSTEPPWNGEVMALGIEPTSTPHGGGTALDDGLVRLPPGGELTWSVDLHVTWTKETP
ncbi:MAG: hypothetical protein KIT89_09315 [Microcella sp.]|uniref:hypothetical protein n=1 Tax=Microcella sp. TaxID=1913979 RepID=UPI0024C592BA|nr:hypothetical protein [Microcella sp.]UYN82906.1 MAG: hypothetical protein KIT89_09315 [Microcella sp.]